MQSLRLPVVATSVLLILLGLDLGAQALHLERLPTGTEMILVAQPLADATSAAWVEAAPSGAPELRTVTSGSLTLAADLAAAFAGDGASVTAAPAAVTLVSPEAATEIRALLQRLLTTPAAPPGPLVTGNAIHEGGVERRLGRPGSDALLRLEVPLPAPSDPQRATVEVLFELIPEVVGRDLPGLLARVEDEAVVLEAPSDPAAAELALSRLRVALDRLSASPELEPETVERARRRVEVRRLARLEEHPGGAALLASRYAQGGPAAVRQYLFGLGGVTAEEARTAARNWLPEHPGRATLVLPPQVFNPRFAPAPEELRLDNNLSAAVLERPGTQLASLTLRPVLVPDLDGDLSATVLARLATALRQVPWSPGWIAVSRRPPALELGAPEDSFAELCESLQQVLATVGADTSAIDAAGGDARRRALRLMALRLGLDDGSDTTPARLLAPGNLALGAVAPDGEVAAEALYKFGVGGAVEDTAPVVESLPTDQRSRVAAPGSTSALAVLLEMPAGSGVELVEVVRHLLADRLTRELATREVEILHPLVPGRSALVVVVSGEVELAKLEDEVRDRWSRILAAVDEDSLTGVRRAAAAELASRRSGALGRSRVCAAVAAGQERWSTSRDLEMRTLGVGTEEVDGLLDGWSGFAGLTTTGAGVMPVVELEP